MRPSMRYNSLVVRRSWGRLLHAEFQWVFVALKLVLVWGSAFGGIILLFFVFAAMRGMLAAIPPGIQIACAALIVLAALLIAIMLGERRRVLEACSHFLSALELFKPATAAEKAHGLSMEKISDLRRRGNALRGKPREWWQALEESLECYAGVEGKQGWFLTRPVAESLPEEKVIAPFYHASFHQAVPGILTALGLLATFVAILLALSGVSYNTQDVVRPVTGIDTLINGLAGKFLSSIIALLLSVLVIVIEKKVCERQIAEEYALLVRRCQEILPFLSHTRILLDLQRLAVSRLVTPEAEYESRLFDAGKS